MLTSLNTTTCGKRAYGNESGYTTCTSYEVEDEFKGKKPRSSSMYTNLDAKNFGRPRFSFYRGLVKIDLKLTKIGGKRVTWSVF